VKFIDNAYPVIVLVGDRMIDEAEIRTLDEHFRRYFLAGKRYAILTAQPPDKNYMDAKGRKLIAEWADQPDVREYSKKLCVGTASLITSAIARGVFTALTWIWTPPTPVRLVGSVTEGLDYCLERLRAENVPLAEAEAVVRGKVRAAVGEAPETRTTGAT
jgi:hypothetical protein